jgi:hypothetical protein
MDISSLWVGDSDFHNYDIENIDGRVDSAAKSCIKTSHRTSGISLRNIMHGKSAFSKAKH